MMKPYLDISKDSLGRIMIHYNGRRLTDEELGRQLAISVRIADWVRCGYCGNKADIDTVSGRQVAHTYITRISQVATEAPTIEKVSCPWSDTLPAPVLGGPTT